MSIWKHIFVNLHGIFLKDLFIFPKYFHKIIINLFIFYNKKKIKQKVFIQKKKVIPCINILEDF